MSDSRCPHRDDLLAFSAGMLSESRSEEIGRHLEHCSHCTDVLEGSLGARNELLALLRSPEPDDGYEREAECQQALADLIRAQSQGGTAVSDVGPVIASTRQYRVVAKLGAGGMGAVFQVVHTRLERVMALKVLLPEKGRQAEAVARFEREIRLVGQLDHPNIVQPTDAGEENCVLFLVMEYVDGADVSALLEQGGPLPVAEACEIVRQAALGLQHAHERGVVHRDIKPSNLMVDRQGTVKILDFGVAHLRGEADPPAAAGRRVMGTLDYMAPEQVDEARDVDHRADIYSLGATLYKLLSGATPLAGGGQRSVWETLRALAAEEIPPIRRRRAEVPEGLAAVLERMLAKDPDRRYDCAADVAAALVPWAAGSDLKPLVRHSNRGPAGADTIDAKDHQTYCAGLSFVEPPSDASGSRLGLRPGQGNSGRCAEPVGTESQPTGVPRLRRPRIAWLLALTLSVVAAAVWGIVIYLRGHHGQRAIEIPAEGVKIVAEGSGSPPATTLAGWPPAPPGETDRWDLGPDWGIPAGILPRPASLAGIRHWQVRFSEPPEVRANNSSRKVRGVRWSPDGRLLAVANGGLGDLHLVSRDGKVVYRQLGAHLEGAKLLAWSSDGRRLATTGQDKIIRVWDSQLREVQVLRGHEGGTLSVSWDPVTGRLASGDSCGKIHTWDADGQLLKVLDSEGWVWGLAWSPDGRWLAAQAKGQVRLWDSDLAPGPTLAGQGEAVDIAWNADGSRLAVACMRAGTAQIWTSAWALEHTLSGHTDEVWAVAWSGAGDQLASSGHDGSVRIWHPDATLLHVLPKAPASVLSLSYSPDGLLAACDYDGRVTAWDSESARPVWVLAMLPNGKTATFTAAGQFTSGDPDAMDASLIYVVQPEQGAERYLKPSEFYTQIPLGPSVRPPAVNPLLEPAQRDLVWSNGPEGGRLSGIVPRPAQLPGILHWQVRFPESAERVVDGGPQAVRCVRWTPDGESLTVADGSGRLHMFSPDGRRERTVKAHSYGIHRMAWSADGRRLASTGKDGAVRLWTRQLEPVRLLRQWSRDTLGAAWDPATNRLATSDCEGGIQIWDGDGRPLAELQGSEWLWALAWSPDGKWLVTDDGIWDAELKPHPPLPHKAESVDFAWSGDGRLLAGAYREEKTVRVWTSQWEPGLILSGHTDVVWAVSWSRDGRKLASGSHDRSVRIWQADGRLLYDLRTHAELVWSLSFAPDGTLVSGSYDRTAIAWDSSTGEPQWVIALLKDGTTATFTAAGQLIEGNPDAVEDELVYVLETGDRQFQLLRPTEFYQRVPAGRLAQRP